MILLLLMDTTFLLSSSGTLRHVVGVGQSVKANNHVNFSENEYYWTRSRTILERNNRIWREKKCCSTNTIQGRTGALWLRQNLMNWVTNCFLIRYILPFQQSVNPSSFQNGSSDRDLASLLKQKPILRTNNIITEFKRD